ncbi:MAG: 30S ribosome-binding factor RbfA [Deltaproteobacteria bacterium]|nr:30S ribosome-binding factor RbfA [Deltaproteobacteria bacterium]
MAEQRRVYKLAERIKSAVALRVPYLSDPRLELVTITSVQLSKDLRIAKIYWTVSGGKERIAQAKEGFDAARRKLRADVSSALGMRSNPELRFYYDDTLDVLEQTGALMDKVKGDDHD